MENASSEIDLTNYSKQELTMSAARANVLALAFILPVLLIFIPTYLWVWQEQFGWQQIKEFYLEHRTLAFFYPLLILLLMIPGAVVHELLHGLTWAAFCKNGVKSIKYGVHWKMLTPYCLCKEMLPLRPYILGGMMPGLVMGILPTIVGLIMGNFFVFLFGVLFTVAAGGDALILWMLRHTKKEDLVQDHPDLIGCILYKRDKF